MAQPDRTQSARKVALGEKRPDRFARALLAVDRDLSEGPLADILGLARTDGGIIVGDGSNFVLETGATARASLGLTIGTDVQAFGAVLDDLNTLGAPASDGQFIVATGAGAFAYESGATARASLGLGSIATQAASNVALTGGTISGMTSIADSEGNLRTPEINTSVSGTLTSAHRDAVNYLTGATTIDGSTGASGSVMTLINDTASGITVTCSGVTSFYVNGADVSSFTLSARGVCSVFFKSSSVAYAIGDIS